MALPDVAPFQSMASIRRFGADTDALCPAWRAAVVTPDQWAATGNPGEAGGVSVGFFVRCATATGYAKPTKAMMDLPIAAHEKIAADLAFDLSLPIPSVVLWERESAAVGHCRYCAVSLVPFTPAHKWGTIEAVPAAAARVATAIADCASAMIPFDTWLHNQDRMNNGNLIVTEDAVAGTVRCAYIDYSYSMTYGWKDRPAPAVSGPVGPYPKSIVVDTAVIAETTSKIEGLAEDAIREIATRIPDGFISSVRRDSVINGLLERRKGLRDALRKTYGAPL